jgi:anthraniloyl-CoA monooxygenase
MRHPNWTVTLSERLPALDTFGFGVGLSGGALRSLGEVDPDVRDEVLEASFAYSSAEFQLPSGTIAVPGFHSGVAIGRAQLLQILTKRAEESGVQMVRETADAESLRRAADLCVVADGVSSPTRRHWGEQFGASITRGRGRFIWCGSAARLKGSSFTAIETPHGLFVAHAYPYAADRSTFVIETSEETWRRAGFDDSMAGTLETDERALTYLSEVFEEVLAGQRLMGNKSQWAHFNTVHCERWTYENIVLLGDAAANAHPSIGSGTKLALESAAALADAVDTSRTLLEAGRDYESKRRPAVERFQDRAHRSQLWWETLACRLHLSPARLAVAYLTRAGVVSIEDLLRTAPSLVREAVAQHSGISVDSVPSEGLVEWVVQQAIVNRPDGESFPGHFDDAWGSEADGVLAEARRRSTAGPVTLVAPADRHLLLNTLAFAERVQTETGNSVNLRYEADVADNLTSKPLSDLAAALVADRVGTISHEPNTSSVLAASLTEVKGAYRR